MEELLSQKPRWGRPIIINRETVEKLEKELPEPAGFRSYKEVHHLFGAVFFMVNLGRLQTRRIVICLFSFKNGYLQ